MFIQWYRQLRVIGKQHPIGLATGRPPREFLDPLHKYCGFLGFSQAICVPYGIRSTSYAICDPFSSPNKSMTFESSFISSSSSVWFLICCQHLILVCRMSCLRVLQIFVRRIFNDKLGRTWNDILLDASSTPPHSGYGYNSKSEFTRC